jgi:hypothetical protein
LYLTHYSNGVTIIETPIQHSSKKNKKAQAMDVYQFQMVLDLLFVKKRHRYPGLMSKEQITVAAEADIKELRLHFK